MLFTVVIRLCSLCAEWQRVAGDAAPSLQPLRHHLQAELRHIHTPAKLDMASIAVDRWLATASAGHCGVTTEYGCAAHQSNGFWQLPDAANWTTAASVCAARCRRCKRCAFISVGLRMRDCSWYASCSHETFKPAPGFRSGAALGLLPGAGERSALPHNLQPGIDACERVPPPSSASRWRSAVESILEPGDYELFARASGTQIEAILGDPAWRQPESDEQLRRIMGNEKFVPHPLNAKGLHALRALLAERATRRRRARLRQTAAMRPLFERLDADGLVVVPGIRNASQLTRGKAANLTPTSPHPAQLPVGGRSYLADLFRMASGFRHLDLEGFDDWERLVHHSADSQRWMHADTFLPTWKAWIFEPAPLVRGPLNYVRGSHRNTEGKLRWLFNRTRQYVSQQAVDRVANPRVTAKRMPALLPYSDATFGFDPAIRFEGFKPGGGLRQARAHEAALREFGFAPPTPVITGSGWTLVLADTSGLHFRGWAAEGVVRTSSVLRSSLRGEDFLPRKNVFYCEQVPEEC
eukprot:7387885-Prymnesium_polylepis.1